MAAPEPGGTFGARGERVVPQAVDTRAAGHGPGNRERETALPRKGSAVIREFLKSLSQCVKLVSLYKPSHPVPAAAVAQAFKSLRTFFADSGWRGLTLSLLDGNWVLNGSKLFAPDPTTEALFDAFRKHSFDTVSMASGIAFYELEAFCEFAAIPQAQARELDTSDYLGQHGVRNISIECAQYERTHEPHPEAPLPEIDSILPPIIKPEPHPPGPGQGGGTRQGSGLGQGAGPGQGSGPGVADMIRGLVEGSVSDPSERARIYGALVRGVKEALDRRGSAAAEKLQGRIERAVHEVERTEQVLSVVADGRVMVDGGGRVLMMDPAAESIVGKRLADVAGQPLLLQVNPGEQMMAMSEDLRLPEGRDPSRKVQVVADDEIAGAFRRSMALVHDESGRVVGTYYALPHVEKFKEAERIKDEFISHISHELKAPLTAINSALEIISEAAASSLDAQGKHFLDISRRNTERLRKMIDELLDFSKLESGEMGVNLVPVPAGPIVREAVDGLGPWAALKKLRLDCADTSASGPVVLADHGRVVQVLTNLLSNAIKSTPQGGHIRVSFFPGTGPDRGSTVFSVQDSGCGISREDQQKLFRKFAQVGTPETRREGVGLGLNIAMRLVRLHNGRLWVESAPGAGATFRFTLPSPRRA